LIVVISVFHDRVSLNNEQWHTQTCWQSG